MAVFAQGDNAEKARAAGADIVGADDLAQQIKGGTMDFDVALATPDMMGVVGPLGRVLGPRGLDALAALGNRHHRHHLGRPRIQGRQDRVPQRQRRKCRRAGRQTRLSREEQLVENINAFLNYLRSLKPANRQRNVHPLDHRLGHHEPRHPGLGLK